MRSCLLLALALVSACEVTASQRVTAACQSICQCEEAPLPALQDRCVERCASEVDSQLSDDCLACVSSHDSCVTLERDCKPICDPVNPPEPGFPDAR